MKRAISAILAIIFVLSLTGCGSLALPAQSSAPQATLAPASEPAATPGPSPTPAPTAEPTPEPTAAPTPAPTPAPTATPSPAPASNNIRPEFKQAMDSYEAFFDEYVEFMQAIAANPSDVGLMMKYASMMLKYADMMASMEAWEDDLNNTELAYYIEVTARIESKLLKAIG